MRKLKEVPEWWQNTINHDSFEEYKIPNVPGLLTHDIIDGKSRYSLQIQENDKSVFYKLTFAEFASFLLEGAWLAHSKKEGKTVEHKTP